MSDLTASEVVLRIRLDMPDGSTLERDITWDDAPTLGRKFRTPPPWLESVRRSWQNPQDPITLNGTVPAGHEATAREWIAA